MRNNDESSRDAAKPAPWNEEDEMAHIEDELRQTDRDLMILNAARLRDEENGVKWYAEVDERGRITKNYIVFEGRVLQGNWCGPRWVFCALVSMSPEERASYCTHDELMGAIRRWLAGNS